MAKLRDSVPRNGSVNVSRIQMEGNGNQGNSWERLRESVRAVMLGIRPTGWGMGGLPSLKVRVLACPALEDQPLGALVFSRFTVTTISISSGCLQFYPGSLYCLGYPVVLLDK